MPPLKAILNLGKRMLQSSGSMTNVASRESNVLAETLAGQGRNAGNIGREIQDAVYHIPPVRCAAGSEKYDGSLNACKSIMHTYSHDIAYINQHVKDKKIMAKAMNQIGNEGMDLVGLEHPFKVSSIANRGEIAMDGTSQVTVSIKRFGLPDEYNSDLAEITHRVMHEKRHVYQNIQRSLAAPEYGYKEMELYADDLTENIRQFSKQGYLKRLKFQNNQMTYDYRAAMDGRFRPNVQAPDVEFAASCSLNQANYITEGSGYWEQFIEADAEAVGNACAKEVEWIIRNIRPNEAKVTSIGHAAKYAQEVGIDFDEAFKLAKAGRLPLGTVRLNSLERMAVNEIKKHFTNMGYNESLIYQIEELAAKEVVKPQYANTHPSKFIKNFIDRVQIN